MYLFGFYGLFNIELNCEAGWGNGCTLQRIPGRMGHWCIMINFEKHLLCACIRLSSQISLWKLYIWRLLIVILHYFYLKLMDFRAIGHYLLTRWMHIYQDEKPTSSLAQFSGIHILCNQVGNDIVFLGFGSEYSWVNRLSSHYKDQSSAGFYYFSFDIEEYLIFCTFRKILWRFYYSFSKCIFKRVQRRAIFQFRIEAQVFVSYL